MENSKNYVTHFMLLGQAYFQFLPEKRAYVLLDNKYYSDLIDGFSLSDEGVETNKKLKEYYGFELHVESDMYGSEVIGLSLSKLN